MHFAIMPPSMVTVSLSAAARHDNRGIKHNFFNLGVPTDVVLKPKLGAEEPDRKSKEAGLTRRGEVLIRICCRHDEFEPGHEAEIAKMVEASLRFGSVDNGFPTQGDRIGVGVSRQLPLDVGQHRVSHVRNTGFFSSHL